MNVAKIGIISGTCKEINRNLTKKFHFSWKLPIFVPMKEYKDIEKRIRDLEESRTMMRIAIFLLEVAIFYLLLR